MNKLTYENDKLKARQTSQPSAIGDILDRAIATQERLEREPIAEQREKRVVPQAKLSDLVIDNDILRGAVNMVYAWRDRKQDGYEDASMVIVGPYGTGKTHIARAVLWSMAYAVDSKPVAPIGRFFVASDLILKLSPTHGEFGSIQVPRPDDFIGNVPIVVIDDVGAEGTIPFVKAEEQRNEVQARYFRIINYCYQWRITLVITSNLSIGQLEQHLGARSWDRLCEMAPKGFMYDLTGVKSWRQMKSGRN